MFLRMLCDKTNMGKRLMKRRNRKMKGDTKLLKDEKKNCNGPAEKCDEKKTLEAKHEHDQLLNRYNNFIILVNYLLLVTQTFLFDFRVDQANLK